MIHRTRLALLPLGLALTLLSAGCSPEDPDGSPLTDAAAAETDLGELPPTPDATSPSDAATEADATPPSDAATEADATPPGDAATEADATPPDPLCPDQDGDGICDDDDELCNLDALPISCRMSAPECPQGQVPEVRDGCYTFRCVTWAECLPGGHPQPKLCESDEDCPEGAPCVDGQCDLSQCEAQPSVDPEHSLYNRFEGIGFENACAVDADCFVGGCSGEICAAEPLPSTCEGLPEEPAGQCGCVAGQCIWHTLHCGEDPEPPEPDACETHEDCPEGAPCVEGQCDLSQCEAQPSVDPDHPLYNRFEGIGFENACAADADCFVSGCSHEICAAEIAMSTCEGLPEEPAGECGCVAGQCIWHTLHCGEDPDPRPQSCGGFAGLRCPDGQVCVDDPADDCDPRNGGADCIGVCVDEVSGGVCGGFAGLPCPDGQVCVDDPTDNCDPRNGGADCIGVCIDDVPGGLCGGFAGLPCTGGQVCVDDPSDDCDPRDGGADCIGVCIDPPTGAPCAGAIGLSCALGKTCVDDLTDDCDPLLGDRDCRGVCVDGQVGPRCVQSFPGDFGLCSAVIGYGINNWGVCGAISGCGCGAGGCDQVLFPTKEACIMSCGR